MKWVEAHNNVSLKTLTQDPRYVPTLEKVKNILNRDEKIHPTFLIDQYAYEILQDTKHVQGLLRRQLISSFSQGASTWENVLDLDQLSQNEKTTWILKNLDCLPEKPGFCIVYLSADGRDASEVREFDLNTKSFKSDGFQIPASRTSITWVDENSVLVSTSFLGQVTDAGHPAEIRLWKRGQKLADAAILMNVPKTSMGADASRFENLTQPVFIFQHSQDIFSTEEFTWDVQTKKIEKLPFPAKHHLAGMFHGHFILATYEKFQVKDKTFSAGSVLALTTNFSGDVLASAIFDGEIGKSVNDIRLTDDHVYLNVLEDVKSKIYSTDDVYHQTKPVLIGSADSAISFFSANKTHLLFSEETFTESPELKIIDPTNKIQTIQKVPPVFDSSKYISEQFWVNSRDGIKIPYTVVRKKDVIMNGLNPTILYGYGGFNVSLLPVYPSIYGVTWLNEGGVYVQANIRGGGEFGPEWHESATLKNKQKSYDDFIAVAEDLISRKITSAAKLGIHGGSNGGLLVGAVTMQRPELFAAAVAANPLLDMIRYPEMSVGASWIGEYGDPKDPEMSEVILKYSPYHNIDKGRAYPQMLIMTATSDDRVHPGHARKFTAKMESLGHSILFVENTSGGHGSATIEDQAAARALRLVYFYQRLDVKLR
jgi:prolyl oligopeptidase